jgi:hypothetical protein
MDLVKYKRSLAKLNLEQNLIDLLNEKVKSLNNANELKLNPELVLLVCNLVEEGVERKYNIDKKELVMNVLDNIYKYSDVEKKHLDDMIEFLHATKKIKKVKLLVKIVHYVASWLKKHFL